MQGTAHHILCAWIVFLIGLQTRGITYTMSQKEVSGRELLYKMWKVLCVRQYILPSFYEVYFECYRVHLQLDLALVYGETEWNIEKDARQEQRWSSEGSWCFLHMGLLFETNDLMCMEHGVRRKLIK